MINPQKERKEQVWYCAKCGEEVSEKDVVKNRKPCPKCGAKTFRGKYPEVMFK